MIIPPNICLRRKKKKDEGLFLGVKWEDPKITKRQAITVIYLARVKPEKTPRHGATAPRLGHLQSTCFANHKELEPGNGIQPI